MRVTAVLVACLLVLGMPASGLRAQTSDGADSDLDSAFALADGGQFEEARLALSRWFAESGGAAASDLLAKARYLRARLATTPDAAESDYRWLAVEGGTTYGPAARLRLAQLNLARGDLDAADASLGRLRSDHPEHPAVADSWLWTGHVAQARGEGRRACEAWDAARRNAYSAGSGWGPLRSADELNAEIEILLGSCAEGAGPAFSVQLGAFQRREPAQQLAATAAAAGVAATLTEPASGTGWYRVRTGTFADRAPAERTARLLVARGFEAVVVRIDG